MLKNVITVASEDLEEFEQYLYCLLYTSDAADD